MYSLLVVDDEKYAVQGVAREIAWKEIQIDRIFEAYNAAQAIEVCRNYPIDIMICDIEMPDLTGIELLEVLNGENIHVKTVFLSAHAKFDYAQKAIQLGCFEYVLKPVDFDKLKEIVKNALAALAEEKEDEKYLLAYQKYHKQWESQFPVLIERFWSDVLNRNIPISREKLESSLELYSVDVSNLKKLLPILLNIEYWNESIEFYKLINSRDEEIMEYGIRNLAAEAVLKGNSGSVLKNYDGNNLILVYCGQDDTETLEEIKQNCNEFINICSQHFQCSISCYVGDTCLPEDIVYEYEQLVKYSQKDLSGSNTVVVQNNTVVEESIQRLYFDDWTTLFETGREEELTAKAETFFNGVKNSTTTAETLEGFYYGLLNTIYSVMNRNNVSVGSVFETKLLRDGLMYTNSAKHMRSWTLYVLKQGMDYLRECGKNNSAVIEKVRAFVADHINEKFTREDIALSINLNPAYLSRIFKKETGITLSEYILRQRMERAKELLVRTNDKISTIAESLGYYHFSHFARIFREVVGIGPNEFRRKYQNVSSEE